MLSRWPVIYCIAWTLFDDVHLDEVDGLVEGVGTVPSRAHFSTLILLKFRSADLNVIELGFGYEYRTHVELFSFHRTQTNDL